MRRWAIILISIISALIILPNMIFYSLAFTGVGPFSNLWHEGFMIETDDSVYIFGHGEQMTYVCPNPNDVKTYHETYIMGEGYETRDLIERYDDKHIWVSMCETGNSEYMFRYCNGTGERWPDHVDRNEDYGTSVPVLILWEMIRI